MNCYVVDAFSDEPLHGNPAGVCVLDHPPSTETMQAVASENNPSETAFVTPKGGGYGLKRFMPAMEMDLCVHATPGSAFVLFSFDEPEKEEISFHARSGPLAVARRGNLFQMDFPARAKADRGRRCDARGAEPEDCQRV